MNYIVVPQTLKAQGTGGILCFSPKSVIDHCIPETPQEETIN